jgi:hypothetical protein
MRLGGTCKKRHLASIPITRNKRPSHE